MSHIYSIITSHKQCKDVSLYFAGVSTLLLHVANKFWTNLTETLVELVYTLDLHTFHHRKNNGSFKIGEKLNLEKVEPL